MPSIYLITGPHGVGKTAVARMIASNIKKCALIEGEDILNMLVSEKVPVGDKENQINLMWENYFSLMKNFLLNNYNVVFCYIMYKDHIEEIKRRFWNLNIKLTVLMANETAIKERDSRRPKEFQKGEKAVKILKLFEKEYNGSPYVLDTSRMKLPDIVDHILKKQKWMK